MRTDRSRLKPTTLMITPMIDMFTVILVFLIVQFAPEEAKIEKDASIALPDAIHKIAAVPKIRLEVTKDFVKLNGETVAGLTPKSSPPSAWFALNVALKGVAEKPEPVLLISDKETAYRYVDKAVAHLASAGFGEVFLLTERVEEEERND
jgi:biopolymer transport protein ExbD